MFSLNEQTQTLDLDLSAVDPEEFVYLDMVLEVSSETEFWPDVRTHGAIFHMGLYLSGLCNEWISEVWLLICCKFINVCEGFIWRPFLNRKHKYPVNIIPVYQDN